MEGAVLYAYRILATAFPALAKFRTNEVLNMTNRPTVHMTIQAPCDLYGQNARQLHNAISGLGGRWTIEKPQENRACSASSLLGLLKLGIQKGDTIRLVGEDASQDPAVLVSAIHQL
jgi:phosphotransferase system HPr-like phosphotransfer protein